MSCRERADTELDMKIINHTKMVVLPNQRLMQMESFKAQANGDFRFRVTGMVTEYKGRNYVLLDKVVVVPDVDQQM